ncbi:helix-turn-helix transcriptional regulator [Rhodobacter capsulatus]|uniref:Helix-turn-helix n=1 Tax=Rhodobacter capsulatus TaxID=1061 RepID=A0A1G7STP4_RHOCA|nr:helix-turn-helix transcriptional regulator [Rhodobacter capsulatus]WER10480.1 helix-turn-helix transcriptional regulator [Rhodobacter capsulatus]SDG26154.1 Helix-turn-helix [Rhodobacter capsulatus]
MSKIGYDERSLAAEAGLSPTAIRKILNGETKRLRDLTLNKLANALRTEPSALTGTANTHTVDETHLEEVDLEAAYGPSVHSALRLGGRRTLWLQYDTASEERYDPTTTIARVVPDEPVLPPGFVKIRSEIERQNERFKLDRSLGKPYFDGPSFCLKRYSIERTDDGNERKTVSWEVSRSRYANNKTAKSGAAANLRRKALKSFEFLDQPIEWLSIGLGVSLVVYTKDRKSFIAARRSDNEQFRRREWDISVVEGINPVKDTRAADANLVYIYDAARRAVQAELGFSVSEGQIKIVGFGVDLEYYQWNFVGYVDSGLTYQEVESYWAMADEKEETIRLKEVPNEPLAAATFLRENLIWSCGMATLFISTIKSAEDQESTRSSLKSALQV